MHFDLIKSVGSLMTSKKETQVDFESLGIQVFFTWLERPAVI